MNSRVHSLATALGLVMGWSSSLLFAGQSTVTLSEAEMIKVQWDTRDLTALDLDGDARIDVAVINNDDARIDLY